MLDAFITIDTEYSAGIFQKEGLSSLDSNYARSILCESTTGNAGIRHQMEVMNRYGLCGVFYVDPMPALIWGQEAVDRIVHPILELGHNVQLHIHTEWLALTSNNPLGDITGRNIKDFSLEQQRQLIRLASDFLVKAGAPRPVAFRAGNYGANDDTLRALASLGIKYDSSFCPGIPNGECDINLPDNIVAPVGHCGVTEIPVSFVKGVGGKRRHAQLTALSFGEMKNALSEAARSGLPAFTIVSHSFELMSRDRSRVNSIICRRFENLCRWIESQESIHTKCFATAEPEAVADYENAAPSAGHISGIARMAEQAASNILYGRD